MLRAVFAAILAFLLFLVAHVLNFHFFIPQERTHSLLCTAFAGLISYAVILYFLPNEAWFQQRLHLNDKKMCYLVFPFLGALFYGFLFLGYLEFYFTAERSITFRMLMIIDKQPEHTISSEQMFAKYDVPGILTKRFDDLVYGGYLVCQNNHYQLTAKGKNTLTIYRFAIDWLRLGNGEVSTRQKI